MNIYLFSLCQTKRHIHMKVFLVIIVLFLSIIYNQSAFLSLCICVSVCLYLSPVDFSPFFCLRLSLHTSSPSELELGNLTSSTYSLSLSIFRLPSCFLLSAFQYIYTHIFQRKQHVWIVLCSVLVCREELCQRWYFLPVDDRLKKHEGPHSRRWLWNTITSVDLD